MLHLRKPNIFQCLTLVITLIFLPIHGGKDKYNESES